METLFPRLQQSHFSGSDCTGYIYWNDDEDEVSVLGYDNTSYVRRILSWVLTQHDIPEDSVVCYNASPYPRRFCPVLWWCIIPQKILSCITMLCHPRRFCPCYDCIISQKILSYVMLHRIPEELCPGLWCFIISQKNCVLSYDAASYPRRFCPLLWHCIIPEDSIPCYDTSS
jgi:hypothetical protein